jgi:hypothetical protein
MPDPEVAGVPIKPERYRPQRDRRQPAGVTRHEDGAFVVRQHRRQHRGRGIAEHDRRQLFADIAGVARVMPHAAGAVTVQQDGIDFAAGLDLAAGLANDGDQPVAEHLRAAADIVAAPGEVGRLRDRELDERHRVGIVGVVSEVRCQRELDRLAAAEQPPEYLAERRVAVADQRPQPPWQGRCVPEPPAAVVLMLAHHRDRLPHRVDALEILPDAAGLLRKLRPGRGERRVEPVRHHEWPVEQRASHLVQVADVDERDVAIDAERAQDRCLGIVAVQTVDLVQRRFDAERAVPIDRRRSAETGVALEHQDLVAGAGK